MYRLLIVDDEKIIVDGIRELFDDYNEYELEICTANSVTQAYNLMLKNKIDIVITDICMPGIDGIELQKRIRLQWPMCKVIFLTGYQNFDYVQTAVRSGSNDFILKTEDDSVIIKAVTRVIKNLENDMQCKKAVEDADLKLKKALPALQREFFNTLVEYEGEMTEQVRLQFTELNIPLIFDESVMLLMGRLDRIPANDTFTNRMKLVYGTQNIIDQFLGNNTSVISVHYEGRIIFCLVQPLIEQKGNEKEENEWEKVVSFVHGTLDSLQAAIKKSLGITISFVATDSQIVWNELAHRFRSGKRLLDRTAGVAEEALLIDFKEKNQPDRAYFASEGSSFNDQMGDMNVLQMHLESGNEKEFFKLLDKIMDNCNEINIYSSDAAREVFYSLAAVFLSHIYRSGLIEPLRREKISFMEKIYKIENHVTWKEVREYYHMLAKWIFDNRIKEYRNSTEKAVDLVNRFITKNIGGDLTLSSIAGICNLNPSYLSRIYKQHSGITISQKIWEVKLSKAVEMLRYSDLKIHEIADNLGFCTHSYFSCFFEKHKGMSPQDYREQLLDEEKIL